MATSAMGHTPILPKKEESRMTPVELSNVLLSEAAIEKQLKTKVHQQYSHAASYHNSLNGRPPVEMTYAASLKLRHPNIRLEDAEEGN